MKGSKKAVILILILGIAVFGFSQYASASQIGVIITQNQLLEQTNTKTLHNVQLEFTNPSLLMLNSGETEFVVSLDGKILGNGVLESFILPPMSKAVVDGKYLSDNIDVDYDEKSQVVEISGMTKYDVFFTSIDVPFSYFPTESQAREFIQQN